MSEMPRIPPHSYEQAQKILETVVLERSCALPSIESIEKVARTIHKLWELRDHASPYELVPKSAALRKCNSKLGVIDHPVPQTHLAKKLLTIPEEDHRIPYISNLLHHFAFYCLISPEEKERLVQAGIDKKMPTSWNEIDRYARYSEVGICMGEEKRFNKKELRDLLSKPPSIFYVYRLRTPTDKVFYIGKGEKFRALSHEKELYKRSFRTYTNWKKLNKIAQIVHAGNEVVYEIESWHTDEAQAFFREDELIIMAEINNLRILCNSNGRRWAGKPSKKLYELRQRQGLET